MEHGTHENELFWRILEDYGDTIGFHGMI